MKNLITLLSAICLSFFSGFAQEYDLDKKYDALIARGDFKSAESFLNNHPEFENENHKLAYLYVLQGDQSKALKTFEKYLEKDSLNIAFNMEKASLLQKRGYLKQALETYDYILTRDSTNIKAWQKKALLLSSNQPIQAAAAYNQLMKLSPENAIYPYRVAQIFEKIKNFDLADRFYEHAVSQDSSSVVILHNYALMLTTKGDYEKALEINKASMKLNPDSDPVFNLNVSLLYKLKKYNEVLVLNNVYESRFKNDLTLTRYLGLTYYKTKSYEQSIATFKNLLKSDPSELKVWYYLGLVYEDMDDLDQAKWAFQESINRNSAGLDNEYYHLAEIAWKQERGYDAYDLYSRAFQVNTKNYKALYQKILIADKINDNKEEVLEMINTYLMRFDYRDAEITAYLEKREKDLKKKLFMQGVYTD